MKSSKSIVIIIPCIIVFVIAIAINLWVTENGVGIHPDSTTYIGTAINILKGNGFYLRGEPMTHYPPLYPIILAISGSFNSNVADSARWLHALLYGVNVVLFGVSIYISTRRNLVAMILGFLIFLSSKAVLTIHSYAFSESPFLMFSLLAYLLFSLYISSNRWVYLILSSVSIGLALATRYVGLALFPPVIIVLFLFVKQPLKYKIKAFFTMVILALTPISFWVVRNLLLTRSAADRSIVFHPRSIRKMGRTLIEVLHDFILPISDSKYLKAFELIIIILILLYMISVLYKKRTQYNLANCIGISYISLGLLFSISYIIMVSFSIFFFDAATPVNERILLPVYLFSTISIISMFFLFSNIEKKQTVWLLFIVCALVSIRINIFPMLSTSNEFHTNGIGYNSRTWNEDPTLSILKSIGPDNKVFSNAYDLISIKTGIEAFPFPKSYNSSTTLENNSYNEQLSSMCDEVMKGDAIIVFLFQIKRDYFPTEETILEKCQPPVLYDVKNGKIYGISIKNKNDSN